jgi:hypothetical protein
MSKMSEDKMLLGGMTYCGLFDGTGQNACLYKQLSDMVTDMNSNLS